MTNQCNGLCIKYKAIHAQGRNITGRYIQGQKRCQICAIYMKWDGLFCPCCRTRLRTKPRNRVFKDILNTRLGTNIRI